MQGYRFGSQASPPVLTGAAAGYPDTDNNHGLLPHDFFVCSVPGGGSANTCSGTGTPLNGGTLTVTFTAPGTYEHLCTVPCHAQAGMKGLLTVVG